MASTGEIGVKVFGNYREMAPAETFLVPAENVEELLLELSGRLQGAGRLGLQNTVVFRNGVNVELTGAEDTALFRGDWVAVFPRVTGTGK